MYINTKPLLALSGRDANIQSLKLIKTLLNDCSDDYTQVYTPGPIEYLEGDENISKAYGLIVLVWLYLIAICAYGLWNGIISHVLFLREGGKCLKKKFDRVKVDPDVTGQRIVPEESNSTVQNQEGAFFF